VNRHEEARASAPNGGQILIGPKSSREGSVFALVSAPPENHDFNVELRKPAKSYEQRMLAQGTIWKAGSSAR
jgi:hypothetical protein